MGKGGYSKSARPGKTGKWLELLKISHREDTKFVRLIDQLLGKGSWYVSLNQEYEGKCKVRHWYSPLVFPEGGGGEKKDGVSCARFERYSHQETESKVCIARFR